ncbi:MAG: hypothetical protein RML36_10685 [Anaerolineae bacterium]|nr:hypothetical protein [Anaerolineae bacterium]MDW8099934.1 hypothetical protein [Anaerolineae bacterium]
MWILRSYWSPLVVPSELEEVLFGAETTEVPSLQALQSRLPGEPQSRPHLFSTLASAVERLLCALGYQRLKGHLSRAGWNNRGRSSSLRVLSDSFIRIMADVWAQRWAVLCPALLAQSDAIVYRWPRVLFTKSPQVRASWVQLKALDYSPQVRPCGLHVAEIGSFRIEDFFRAIVSRNNSPQRFLRLKSEIVYRAL